MTRDSTMASRCAVLVFAHVVRGLLALVALSALVVGLPWALAQHARITGRVVQLPAQDAREVEQLLAALREAGVAVEDVEMRKADLEDVFIDLMAGEQTPLEVAR